MSTRTERLVALHYYRRLCRARASLWSTHAFVAGVEEVTGGKAAESTSSMLQVLVVSAGVRAALGSVLMRVESLTVDDVSDEAVADVRRAAMEGSRDQ